MYSEADSVFLLTFFLLQGSLYMRDILLNFLRGRGLHFPMARIARYAYGLLTTAVSYGRLDR